MDLVDPTFDFVSETRSADRVRHRDDQYPHELFATPPYDGLLVSKAIVDGSGGLSGKYSIAQRQRFLRVGAHRFFRLDARPETANLTIMGDCGAFTYVKEPEPPFSVTEVVEFYETAGFDAGLSLDHIVLAFNAKADEPMLIDTVPEDWRLRRELTIDLASEFLRTVQSRKSRFTPIGVAQGWSPKSYAKSVSSLQRIGYRRIALGGLVPLRTSEILSVLSAIRDGRTATDQLHLLGVTRIDHIDAFAAAGVTSFDTTSPLRRAFKDAKHNYFTPNRTYTAIRVPMVESTPRLRQRIAAGMIDASEARTCEIEAMTALLAYDRGELSVSTALEAVLRYSELHEPNARREKIYREVLEDRPWNACSCEVCEQIGIHAVVFRGAERNRRRGFHNIHVFRRQLERRIPPSLGVNSG